MVVVGRDRAANSALFSWLRAIDLQPLEWDTLVAETGSGSPYKGGVLDRAFVVAQAVIVLLTPDDRVRLREDLTDRNEERTPSFQGRSNVLFEAGMAFALHPERTILIEYGSELRDISDLLGRHTVRLRDASSLNSLASRLETAGCAVSRSGGGWLDYSGFTKAAPKIKRSIAQQYGAPEV